MKNHILTIVAWATIGCLWILNCGPLSGVAPPRANAAELDVRLWNLEQGGPVALSGEWGFAWRQLLESGQPRAGQSPVYVMVPHVWSNSAATGYAPYGYATYILRIQLPGSDQGTASAPRFALRIPELGAAYSLYADGQLLHRVGRVAADPGEYAPAFGPAVVSLPPSADLTLYLQVANFVHGGSGLNEQPMLGTLPQMLAWQQYDRNVAILTLGALGIMGLYQWIQFSLRRVDPRPFWFGSFCLVLAVRSVVTGEYLLARWIEALPFALLFKLEYLTLVFGTLAIGFYLARLLPDEFPTWFAPGLASVSALYVALLVLTPLSWCYRVGISFQFVAIGTILFCAARVGLGVRRGRAGAGGTLVGGLIVSAAVIFDILDNYQGVEFSSLTGVVPFALLLFTLFQAGTLSRRSASAFATAERLSVELEDRVRRRTRDLETARLQSEAANRTRSEFLATMSHELRTPLNSIIGTADLLSESELTNSQREFVRVLNRSAHHLLQQVNRMLDLSRVEAGRLELVPEPVDLPVFIGEVITDLQRSAAEKPELSLSCRVEARDLRPDEDLVMVDATRLRQILDNLIGNAIKFTRAGEVRLTVYVLSRTADSVHLLFEVEDSGIGIPHEKQAQIFESFAQLDSSNTRPYQGTGLGLAIVRRMVELMGGEIGVESEPGRGSRFWFRIRLPIVSRAEVQRMAESESAPAAAGAGGRRPSVVGPAGPIILRQGLRIVLVEDNPDNYFLVSKFLEDSGVELRHAANGKEALDLIRAPDVDLILMDLQMPVMDGYEATRRIRERESRENLPPIPILALTANTTREDMARTRAEGFDGHLSKPIRKNELLAAIAWYSRRSPGPRT